MQKEVVLIIAAHPDDEVLGMGGTVLKLKKQNYNLNLLILSNGEDSRGKGNEKQIKKRKIQAERVSKLLRINKIFFEDFPDNEFDSVSLLSIVKKVEKKISETKPSIVYTHNPNDLNIDHRITFQSVLTACRPQPGFFVKKILAFETLSSTEWQLKNAKNAFCPTEYVNIEKSIDKKIKILEIYKDELREFPHPRSEKGVRVLSEYRGMEVGYKNAEAFQVIRKLYD